MTSQPNTIFTNEYVDKWIIENNYIDIFTYFRPAKYFPHKESFTKT